jgi:multidrug efflux pump subunit AcrA (membrane-fusion protein)
MKILSVWFGLLALLLNFPAMAADVEALIQWSRRTELATPVSGVVASVAVNAGERAAKGQLLLTLDDARSGPRCSSRSAARAPQR